MKRAVYLEDVRGHIIVESVNAINAHKGLSVIATQIIPTRHHLGAIDAEQRHMPHVQRYDAFVHYQVDHDALTAIVTAERQAGVSITMPDDDEVTL